MWRKWRWVSGINYWPLLHTGHVLRLRGRRTKRSAFLNKACVSLDGLEFRSGKEAGFL